MSVDHRIDHIDSIVYQGFWLEAFFREPGSLVGVDEHPKLRGVDLYVPSAEPREFRNLIFHDSRHIGQVCFRVTISSIRHPWHPVEREHRRARNGDLSTTTRLRPEICELFGGQMPVPPDFFDDA